MFRLKVNMCDLFRNVQRIGECRTTCRRFYAGVLSQNLDYQRYPERLSVSPEITQMLREDIKACTLCRERFAATHTGHSPRPVVWFDTSARILVAGQAPGMKVHKAGVPFCDPSGDRLRDWMGIDKHVFYDKSRIAIVPMAFCFPGYSAKGSDLPPPPVCARTWRDRVMADLKHVRLTVIIGGYAMKYHLGEKTSVTEAVANWRARGEDIFVLPHPSWRNTGWLKKNPWFDAEVVPRLQRRVQEALGD